MFILFIFFFGVCEVVSCFIGSVGDYDCFVEMVCVKCYVFLGEVMYGICEFY